MTPATLQVKDLEIGYGEKKILRDLSFNISCPGLFAILGKNGVGKSSLLKALNGDIECTGQIVVNNKDLNKHSIQELSNTISYLPQKLDLGIDMKVYDLIEFGRIRYRSFLSKLNSNELDMIDEAISKCGLKHLSDKYLSEISGGERQLAWLAQVVVQDTPIVFLDEPTLNLDLSNRKFVFDLIRDFYTKGNKLVVLVTHEIEYLLEQEGKALLISDDGHAIDSLSKDFLSRARKEMEIRSVLE